MTTAVADPPVAQVADEPRFNPAAYMRELKGRGGTAEYLDVKWRLVWLRSEHPDAQITTEPYTLTDKLAIFRGHVSIPGGGSATGWGSETPGDFKDYIEKAETKALGRALIALGYGTADAAADEAIDSAPVERRPAQLAARRAAPAPVELAAVAPAAMAAPDFADYVKAIKAMDTDGVAGKEIVAFIKEHDDSCDEEQHAQVRRVWTVIVERRKAVVAARQAEAAPADDAPWEAVVGQPAQPPAATNGADQPITEAQRLAIRSLGRQRGVDERQILPTVQSLLPGVMITDIAQVTRGQINQVLDGLRRLPLPESQAAAVALGGQS